MKVGIFDSGIGGLTVLKKAMEKLPSLDYIYYSDNLNAPYGTKSKKEVLKLVEDVVAFLIKKDVDAVVIACNTATSIAAEILREKHEIPIIGMEPAVKLALEEVKEKERVLAFATPLTLKEKKYQELVNKFDSEQLVDSVPMPKLVEFAEGNSFKREEVLGYLKNQLSHLELESYGAVVLGCTHFLYFKDFILEFFGRDIKVLEGSEGTVNQLSRMLNYIEENKTQGKTVVYYSEELDREEVILNRYFDILNKLK